MAGKLAAIALGMLAVIMCASEIWTEIKRIRAKRKNREIAASKAKFFDKKIVKEFSELCHLVKDKNGDIHYVSSCFTVAGYETMIFRFTGTVADLDDWVQHIDWRGENRILYLEQRHMCRGHQEIIKNLESYLPKKEVKQ